jgi:hypothetical protein
MAQDPIEIRGLTELIQRFGHAEENVLSKSLMSEIGARVIFWIQRRTASGVDVTGRRFKKYTPQYKLFREKEGRSGDTVNLFFTGSMMSSMDHSATEYTAKVFFQNTSDTSGTSNPLKAFALNQERRFFALSTQEQDEIEEMVSEHIGELLSEGT